MALRLRRGTNAERQLITPLEGEPIFTTDTKDLYIGDGSTAGGIKVGGDIPSSINDLTDVNISGISVGQVLKWNGTQFVAGNDDNTGTGSIGTGIVDGQIYNISISGNDSSLIVDANRNTLRGVFEGVAYADVIGSIFSDNDSSVILDATNRILSINDIEFTTLNPTITAPNNVTITAPGGVGIENVQFNTGSQVEPDIDNNGFIGSFAKRFAEGHFNELYADRAEGNWQGTFSGDDSTILVDGLTGEHFGLFNGNLIGDVTGNITGNVDGNLTGTVRGNLIGDVKGSIFIDDSSIIISGETGEIYPTAIRGSNIAILPDVAGPTDFSIRADDDRANLRLVRQSESPINDNSFLGTIFFDETEIGVDTTRALIGSTTNVMVFGIDATGAFNNPSKYFTFTKEGNFGIGTFEALAKVEVKDGSIYLNDSRDLNLLASPLQGEMTYDATADAITFRTATEWRNVVSYNASTNITDLPGNVIAIGDISAAAFKGSLMGDDSTTIVDAISGNVTAPGFVQFGSFTKLERDNLSALNGMVIYNTTSNKFQGYQNNAWINLDDGSADP